jgi:hypothetical protein
MVTTLLYFLVNAPMWIYLFPPITPIIAYINSVISNAGQRGLLMAAAMGAIVTGIRILLGKERAHVGL